jgi:hypothetical protein
MSPVASISFAGDFVPRALVQSYSSKAMITDKGSSIKQGIYAFA